MSSILSAYLGMPISGNARYGNDSIWTLHIWPRQNSFANQDPSPGSPYTVRRSQHWPHQTLDIHMETTGSSTRSPYMELVNTSTSDITDSMDIADLYWHHSDDLTSSAEGYTCQSSQVHTPMCTHPYAWPCPLGWGHFSPLGHLTVCIFIIWRPSAMGFLTLWI